MQENDCTNRGYVLDGMPRTYIDAKGVFTWVPKKKKKKPKKVEEENKHEAEGEEEQ